MYGHVITKFSGMGRFTYLWGSVHPRVELRDLLLVSYVVNFISEEEFLVLYKEYLPANLSFELEREIK